MGVYLNAVKVKTVYSAFEKINFNEENKFLKELSTAAGINFENCSDLVSIEKEVFEKLLKSKRLDKADKQKVKKLLSLYKDDDYVEFLIY